MALIQPYCYRPRHQIWLFLLQTSNLVPKRGSRWFLASSTTHYHMSDFTAFLAHFPIFGLFSLIRSTFLDPKLMADHKLLALYHFRSRSSLFLIQSSQNTKKNKASGNTTDLSTSHGRISFWFLSWFFVNIRKTLNKEKVRYTPQNFSKLFFEKCMSPFFLWSVLKNFGRCNGSFLNWKSSLYSWKTMTEIKIKFFRGKCLNQWYFQTPIFLGFLATLDQNKTQLGSEMI